MKLLPWLKQARREGRKGIVTKGGPWSNHVHAAAYTAKTEGLSFTAIIKAKNGMITPMLEDALQWGATIEYADNDAWLDENRWESFALAVNCLYVPLGGEGPMAVEGVRSYIDELNLPAADYILCPIGTGTTLKGIAQSNLNYNTIIGINPGINDSNYGQLLSHLKQVLPSREFLLMENKLLKKFGKWPVFLPAKMNEWYHEWQLPTDIVYTAKMFFIFEELVAGGFFKRDSNILLVHTGGLQGNRSLPPEVLDY